MSSSTLQVFTCDFCGLVQVLPEDEDKVSDVLKAWGAMSYRRQIPAAAIIGSVALESVTVDLCPECVTAALMGVQNRTTKVLHGGD